MTVGNEFKKFAAQQLGKKYCRCFWPVEECKKEAIRAHSIQNSQIIEVLTRDGHVIMPQFKIDFEKGPEIKFKEVGRNKATTFTGLCSDHDNLLFKHIDVQEIDLSNKEPLFLLSYRSVLKEIHASSKAAIDVQSSYLKGIDLGKFDPDALDPPMVFATQKLMDAYVVHIYKLLYDQLFLKKDWDQVEHKHFIIDIEKPILAVSSVFSSHLYSEVTKGPAFLSLNVFPQNKKTHVIFSYLIVHHDQVQRVFNHLNYADKHYLMYELSKLILRKCENFVMSPEVFETYNPEQIDAIEKYFILTTLDPDVELDDPKLFLFGPA